MFRALPAYGSTRPDDFWASHVPEHWRVVPGMAVVSENKRKNDGLVENQVLSLSFGRVVVKPIEKQRGLVPESYEGYQILNPGDIVIRPTDLQNDQRSNRVGMVRDRGIITSAYIGLQARQPWSTDYAYAYFATVDSTKRIYGMGSGLRQQLGWVDLKRDRACGPDCRSGGTSLSGRRWQLEPLHISKGALTGNVAVVPNDWQHEAYVNQHVALVRSKHSEIDAQFLGHAMKSLPCQYQFKGSEYGGTKQGLGLDEVKNLEVLLPPLAEQRAIVAAIKVETERIDSAIRRAEQEVEVLGEFRTRLVADVVTGQVDVRAIAAKLPDVEPAVAWGDAGVGDDVDLVELDDVLTDSDA